MTELGSTPASRRVVCGVLLAGFTGPIVSACGSDATSGSAGSPSGTGGTPGVTPSGPAGQALVAAADVPVGGIALVEDAGVVVTQPEQGVFKAFSATCTHQGTRLDAKLDDGRLHCSNHGSEFSPADGSVQMGPATRALPEIAVKVEGEQVVRA